MGAYADAIVIIMLVIFAIIGIALWVVAVKQVVQSPISILRKLTWLLVLLGTGPVGLALWFSVGYGDLRRQREIAHHRAWASRTYADSTIGSDALAEAH